MISVWCSGASGETERDERGERLEGEGIHCDPCIVNSSSVPGRDRQREKGRERCGAGGLEEDLFTGKEICLGMDWTAVQPEPELFADANVWTLSQLPECLLTHTFPFPFPFPFYLPSLIATFPPSTTPHLHQMLRSQSS